MNGGRLPIALALLVAGIFSCPGAFATSKSAPNDSATPMLSPNAEAAARLMREGVALHDRGEFDGAISKYREALRFEPDDLHVIYELVFSLYSKKDLVEAERVARAVAQRKSDLQAGFWMILGNIDDDSGKLSSAISDYQEAIRLYPMLKLAHFNLGAAYLRNGNLVEARGAFELEASKNPGHPGTQFMLGKTYEKSGFRVPAVLALSRFLFLEPNTDRSREARESLESIFTANVTVNSRSMTTMTVDPNASKAEGDFSGAELMMALTQASSTIDPKDMPKDQAPLEFSHLGHPLERLASTLAMMSESSGEMKNGGFAADYYLPFFTALGRGRRIEAFVRLAYAGAKLPKNDEWLVQHALEVEALRTWANAFPWPRPGPRLP